MLLIKGCDPARPEAGTWWLTPGGGIEADESPEDAIVREVLEETGLHVEPDRLGAIVATRVAEFEFDNLSYRQAECFFAVAVDAFVPHERGWDDIEQQALLEHRWWTLAELHATAERLYPSELAKLVAAVLAGPITQPITLSGD